MERRRRARHRRRAMVASVLCFLLSTAGIATAQCELATLTDPAGTTGDEFGSAVAFDGAHAVVGAPAGEKAIVFRFDGSNWIEAATLTSSLTTVDAQFGRTVAIDGTLIAVGAPSDDEVAIDAGAVLVFRYDGSTWIEEAKLTADDPEVSDGLGASGLAVGANAVVVGAPSVADPTVYSFGRSGGAWSQDQRITPSPFVEGFGVGVDFDGRRLAITSSGGTPRVDFYRRELGTWVENDSSSGTAGDDYGEVSFSGHRVAVGAPGAAGGDGAVIVHRFDGSGWTVDATITEAGTQAFGSSVDLHGDTLLIGADATANPSVNTGVAYVLRRTDLGWISTDELNIGSDDGAQQGAAVALFGSLALVGAPSGDAGSADSGIVTAYATTTETSERLVASDPSDSMWYGISSATWGSRVMIGSPNANGAVLSTAGAAYVHRDDLGSWVEETKLVASVGANPDQFADVVALYGDVAAVGAPQRNGGEGAAYVYRFDGAAWVEEQLLLGSDAVGQQHEFGISIALRNDVIAIGAVFDDEFGPAAGKVYIFEYDDGAGTWTEAAVLTPSELDPFWNFGLAVDFDGDRLVVGASGVTVPPGLTAAGAVYVFEYDGSTWIETQMLTSSAPASANRFGKEVSLWGGWLAVGTPSGDEGGLNSGSVSLFRFDGTDWIESDVLVPGAIDPGDQVGNRVSIDAGVLATTSPQDDIVVPNAGSISRFRWSGLGWTEESRLVSSEPDELETFGSGLSLGFGRLVAGAPFTDGPFINTGTVNVISLTASVCDESFVRADANLDGVVDIADVVALLDHLFAGAPTTCADVFDVNANGSLSITDAFQLLCAIFCVGDAPILPPYPNCGTNLYGPGVGCDLYGVCP